MSVDTVARRYSSALADVVIKSGETDPVKSELKTWEELINSNRQLLEAFRNPTVAHASKERVLESLIEKLKPTRTTANFLRILLKNSRLINLGAINERFAGVLDERSGVTSGNVISARALTNDEKSEMLQSLLKLTGKRVNLDFTIDENIIGGVVTRIGSTVYDGSVRTHLEELRDKLVNG